MVDTPFSKLAAAAAMTGAEITMISQLSTSVTISAATISAQASDNSFNDSGDGFVSAGFAVDDYVHVEGFTGDTANNIFSAKITALTAGKMTIGGTDGDVIVDDAAGETVTITKWVSRRASFPGASGSHRGALVALSADAASTNYTSAGVTIPFDTDDEVYDTDSIHEGVTNPSRLTVPTGVTKVRIRAQAVHAGTGSSGNWNDLTITKNGSSAYAGCPMCFVETTTASGRTQASSPVLVVTAGDYFEMQYRIESDTSVVLLADQTWFAMEIVE